MHFYRLGSKTSFELSDDTISLVASHLTAGIMAANKGVQHETAKSAVDFFIEVMAELQTKNIVNEPPDPNSYLEEG